jgi:hypothetical protein
MALLTLSLAMLVLCQVVGTPTTACTAHNDCPVGQFCEGRPACLDSESYAERGTGVTCTNLTWHNCSDFVISALAPIERSSVVSERLERCPLACGACERLCLQHTPKRVWVPPTNVTYVVVPATNESAASVTTIPPQRGRCLPAENDTALSGQHLTLQLCTGCLKLCNDSLSSVAQACTLPCIAIDGDCCSRAFSLQCPATEPDIYFQGLHGFRYYGGIVGCSICDSTQVSLPLGGGLEDQLLVPLSTQDTQFGQRWRTSNGAIRDVRQCSAINSNFNGTFALTCEQRRTLKADTSGCSERKFLPTHGWKYRG